LSIVCGTAIKFELGAFAAFAFLSIHTAASLPSLRFYGEAAQPPSSGVTISLSHRGSRRFPPTKIFASFSGSSTKKKTANEFLDFQRGKILPFQAQTARVIPVTKKEVN